MLPTTTDKVEAMQSFHNQVLAYNGGRWFSFEQYLTAFYRAILGRCSVAVDGGANIGDHTTKMAVAVAPYGRVLAIEPVPEHLFQLTNRAVAAGVSESTLEIIALGLWSKQGQSEFHRVVHPDEHGLSGLIPRVYTKDHTIAKIRIELQALDELCVGLERLDFIKLDLEGAEWDALNGGQSTIDRFRPIIAFEQDLLSPQYFGYTWKDLLDFFLTRSYVVCDLFGIAYSSPEMLANRAIWDFVAFPKESPKGTLALKAVRRKMQSDGVLPKAAGMLPPLVA